MCTRGRRPFRRIHVLDRSGVGCQWEVCCWWLPGLRRRHARWGNGRLVASPAIAYDCFYFWSKVRQFFTPGWHRFMDMLILDIENVALAKGWLTTLHKT